MTIQKLKQTSFFFPSLAQDIFLIIRTIHDINIEHSLSLNINNKKTSILETIIPHREWYIERQKWKPPIKLLQYKLQQ